MAMARSMESREQMPVIGASKKAPRQELDPATRTEEEQVACAMKMSMAEENTRGRDVPLGAHKEGNNVPSLQADQGRMLYEDPGAGVMEGTLRGPTVSRPDPPKGPLGHFITKVGPWARPSSRNSKPPPPADKAKLIVTALPSRLVDIRD